jgi:hypothetical protein
VDLFRFLQNDHRTILTRLATMRRTTYRAAQTRTALLRDVKELLEALAEFEEEVFYPLLRKHRPVRSLLEESRRDHKEIKRLLKKWIPVPPREDEWEQHFRETSVVVHRLVSREKTKLFPRARKILTPEQLEDMSTRIQEARNELAEAKLHLKISEN